jgi:FdhD protein
MNNGIKEVNVIRLPGNEESPSNVKDDTVIEKEILIAIEDVGNFKLMHTPGNNEALAAGFALTNGIIKSRADIKSIVESKDEPDTIRLRLAEAVHDVPAHNLANSSLRGSSGSHYIEPHMSGEMKCGNDLKVSADVLHEAVGKMHSLQVIFARTGGTHAAAVFNAECRIISFAEDIGRHNAFDKVIGKALLNGDNIEGCGVALSGRVSLEMAVKAAIAGLELIAAVSAPSSLAIDVADACNITLCGFIRKDRLTIYTHPERVVIGDNLK